MDTHPATIARWPEVLMLIGSTVGLFDAGYLSYEHFAKGEVSCSFLAGCEIVTTSVYATVGFMPVALLGFLYYALLFILLVRYSYTERLVFLQRAAVLSIVGFIASLWFVYLQVFVIKALCLYCLLSAASTTIVFIPGMYVLRYMYVRKSVHGTFQNT